MMPFRIRPQECRSRMMMMLAILSLAVVGAVKVVSGTIRMISGGEGK